MCTATHIHIENTQSGHPAHTTLEEFLENTSISTDSKPMPPASENSNNLARRGCSKNDTAPSTPMTSNLTSKLIGRGSHSLVFQYQHAVTGETYAVKEPRSPAAKLACQSPQGVKDALMLAELDHENVVCHRYGRTDGSMVMEYVEGGSLLDVMERSGGKLSEFHTAHFTRQILQGVSYLHSKGVTHRDIKPANVLFDSHTGTVKITDIVSVAEASTMKRSGVIVPVGTPSFLAPEVVVTGNHEPASDIWALGCCVLQLLTGRIPWYEEDSKFSSLFKIGNGQHPKLPDGLSASANSFLLACFQPIESRPSADDLLKHSLIAGLVAHPPSQLSSTEVEIPPSGPPSP